MTNFCFSLDFELAIGINSSQHSKHIDPLIGRKAIPKIIILCKKYDVPATFATVGELFKKQSDNSDVFHALDLINLIKDNDFEIACHGLTHTSFNMLDKDLAEKEILECIRLAKKLNIKFKSIIFPRNAVRYLNLVEKHGFTHFASNPFPKGFLVDFNPKQFSFSKPSKLTDFKLTEVPRTRHLKPI
ncbi:MAG: polysaccharide deacetylase family protein, partial [archaeon]